MKTELVPIEADLDFLFGFLSIYTEPQELEIFKANPDFQCESGVTDIDASRKC